MSNMLFDICIIGAGMYGSAAARHASANPTIRVCLIGPNEPKENEKETRDIHSAHYDEGRIVHIAYANHSMQVLVKNTIKRFRELERLSGIEFYNPVGTIVTVEKNTSSFYELLQGLEMHGVSFVDLSKGNRLKNRFPFLKLDPQDYALFDDDRAGYINCRKIVEAEKKIAEMQGCYIIDDIVEEVKDNINGIHKITTKNKGIIQAKRVLFCTGAFTLFKRFHPIKRLKMMVNKETVVFLRIPVHETKRLSSMPTLLMYRDGLAGLPSKGAYILPPIKYPDGHWYLKIGYLGQLDDTELSTLEESRQWYNSDGCPLVTRHYSRFLIDILPGLLVDEVSSKTCISCDSPTDLPYIDRITPTVAVAVVGNGRGATMCDEVGRLAAELCLTGKWDSELPKKPFEAIFKQ
ncbi:monomeric sarcosine oxidase [Trichonephila clavipes]|nr:monomeric sarcosine oxidase [Trichonephila clavipes]